MKNKIYKKVGLLSISALVALSFSAQVKAEQECKEVEKTNYYLFSGIHDESELSEISDTAIVTYNGTFFPSLPKDATISNKTRVCLSTDEDTNNCSNDGFDLEKFYQTYKKVLTAHAANKTATEINFVASYALVSKDGKIQNKTQEDFAYYLSDESNSNITYYLHNYWFKSDEKNQVRSEPSNDIVRYQGIEDKNLIGAAVIPQKTSISAPDAAGTEAIVFYITRTIVKDDLKGKTAYALVEKNDTKKYLTPAIYKLTYTVNECSDKPEPTPEKKFEATIKYVDKDTGKEFTDKRWTLTDLEDGAKNTQKSPKIDGCTPDEEEVAWRIAGKNFEHTVYYVCEVDNTPKTGNVLIFVAWVVGLSALGYSVYWFKKNKQEEV